MITKEGVTIWCSRIKNTQFVPFDVIYDLPGHCFFRVKNKARVFNIPYGDPNPVTCASQETETEQQDLKRKAKVALDLVEAGLVADAMQDGSRWKKAKTAINVLGNLLLADTLPIPPKQISPPPPTDQELPPLEQQQNGVDDEKKLQEFYDSLAASTAHI
uniref:WHEP-TRS domain-containing protein n=1 Tax=Globodera pallida TaxID=36090 RepID=A0A183BZP9_GLOPA